jgi:hypothetical protein
VSRTSAPLATLVNEMADCLHIRVSESYLGSWPNGTLLGESRTRCHRDLCPFSEMDPFARVSFIREQESCHYPFQKVWPHPGVSAFDRPLRKQKKNAIVSTLHPLCVTLGIFFTSLLFRQLWIFIGPLLMFDMQSNLVVLEEYVSRFLPSFWYEVWGAISAMKSRLHEMPDKIRGGGVI